MVTPSVVEPLVSGSDGSIVHVEPTNDDFSDDTPQLSLETGVHSPLMDEIDVAPQVEGALLSYVLISSKLVVVGMRVFQLM
ncbi:hypothetical protein V6N13_089592 [Hibiscus sabdariffa]